MDVKWIKITTNIFDDEKIKLIDAMPERDGIFVIWIKLLTLAGRINEDGLIYLNDDVPYTDEMLATVFNRPVTVVRLALKVFSDFRMITIDDSTIEIINWEKHQNISGLDKIREQTKLRVRNLRNRKNITHCNGTVTLRNATEQDKNKTRTRIEGKKNPPIPGSLSTFNEKQMQRIAICIANARGCSIGSEANIVAVTEIIGDYERQKDKRLITDPIKYIMGMIQKQRV